eukprot:EG_transcript_19718
MSLRRLPADCVPPILDFLPVRGLLQLRLASSEWNVTVREAPVAAMQVWRSLAAARAYLLRQPSPELVALCSRVGADGTRRLEALRRGPAIKARLAQWVATAALEEEEREEAAGLCAGLELDFLQVEAGAGEQTWQLECSLADNAVHYRQVTQHGDDEDVYRCRVFLRVNGAVLLQGHFVSTDCPSSAHLRQLQDGLSAHFRAELPPPLRVLSRVLGYAVQDPEYAEGLPWALELRPGGL